MTKLAKAQSVQKTFSLLVDRVPYEIKIVPFVFNGVNRFYVGINGSPEHVFTWDSEIKKLRPIDDGSSIIPDILEEAINQKLQQFVVPF